MSWSLATLPKQLRPYTCKRHGGAVREIRRMKGSSLISAVKEMQC